MPPTLHADRHLVRASGGSRRHLVARVTAPGSLPGRTRPPAAIAFVIDRSGSMEGDKMRHAQAAVVESLARLVPADHFTVVAYDDVVEVVVAPTVADEVSRLDATRRVRRLRARGSTDLHGGWTAGARGLLPVLGADTIGRCLLLTDGLANQGVTDPESLAHVATDLRAQGVSTSTFGIGADFEEGLLGRIADAGGGTFRFIERSTDIARFVGDELGEALDVVARDVVVHVELPEGAELEVIGPWVATREGRTARITLPDLVACQTLELVLEVRLPAGRPGTTCAVRVAVASRDQALGLGASSIDFRFASHREVEGEPRDRELDRLVAERLAGAARERSALLRRDGDVPGAARALREVAARIARHAGGDPALEALVEALHRDARRIEGPIDGLALKRLHFEATAVLRDKLADGRSRRS